MSLEKTVAAKLAAQRGQEEASALWERLWTAYETGSFDGAEALLRDLLHPSERDGGTDEKR